MSPTNICETVVGQLRTLETRAELDPSDLWPCFLVNWVPSPFLPMKMDNIHQGIMGSRVYGDCHKLPEDKRQLYKPVT